MRLRQRVPARRPITDLPLVHPGWTVAGWLLLVAVVLVAGRAYGGTYENDIELPGTEAAAGAELLAEHGGGEGGYGGELVLHDPDGLEDDAAALDALTARLAGIDGVREVGDPAAPGSVSTDGTTVLLSVRLDEAPRNLDDDQRTALLDATDGLPDAVEASWAGTLGSVLADDGPHRLPELIGLVTALLVLLVVFGSVAAAVLPLLASVLGVLAGIGLLSLLAAAITLGTSAPTLATMIGLGCGIDYALFLVTRARQHLLDGEPPRAAVRRALRSSGHAVVVAAGTVAVALLGLYASGITFVARLGLAAVVTLGTAALAAVTLVPALLVLVGRRVDRVAVRPARAEVEQYGGAWPGHARWVARHAGVVAVTSTLLLGVLAIPLLSIELGHVDESVDPAGSSTRVAYDRTVDAFGAGASTDIVAVLDLQGSPPDPAALDAATQVLAEHDGVAAVPPFTVSAGGAIATTTVVPTTAASDTATADLVHDLVADVAPEVESAAGGTLLLTGQTVAQVEFADRVAERLPLIIALVVAAAFVLLTVTFRSVVVAAKAAAMNLVSIGASYGVLVAVFQWQWGSGLLGVDDAVPIESFVPMMMFAIVFGLSMDYEIFLLSRVREEWLAGAGTTQAVANGLAGTARVISAAALIMVCVFLAFTLQDDVAVTMLAVGLAVSVAVDATVVRLLLVPATMVLLGRANWWLPRWLARLLPEPAR